jgi:cobalt-zinc-cadmium efflux system membrane fusion protein
VDLPDPGGGDMPGLMADREPHGSSGHPVRRLSRKQQIVLAGAIAVVLVAAMELGPLALHPPAAPAATGQADQASTGNVFKPTPQQWAGLTMAPADPMTFRVQEDTDGKIANDDDVTTQVFSPFTGRVTHLFVKAGDKVKRGDPLVAVQAAEFVQAQTDLITAAATLRTARAQLNLAQTNEKRQHALFLAQGGALKDWQQSQVDLATAEGSTHSAEIALGAVRNRLRILGRTDPEIEAMETTAVAPRFSPEAQILAPIDGTVVQRQVGLGQNVVSQSNGGTSPVFAIGDLSKVWLLANAREVDAGLIHVGDPVEVRVLAYPGRLFHARIAYVAPSLDPVTHRLPVRAEVENSDGALKPEMFASFRIIMGEGVSDPAVPDSAVIYEGSNAHVWVAHVADKTIELRQIHTGRVSDGMVQVTGGLRSNETVVTRGGLFIDRATTGD